MNHSARAKECRRRHDGGRGDSADFNIFHENFGALTNSQAGFMPQYAARMTTLTAGDASAAATAPAAESADWRAAAIAMLSVRVIQRFICWGGGSRRFFCDP
jgi:hypothetical protein